MTRVSFYVDGFNLYHAINVLRRDSLKWLNLRALAESFLTEGETLARIAYFSAHVPWDKGKRARHVSYVKALNAIGVDTYIGGFQKVNKHCKQQDRYCPFHEEKRTDVELAVTCIRDAIYNRFDKAILVTADTDQIPTVQSLKSIRPPKTVIIAVPPGRRANARDLINNADAWKEISEGRLGTCLLPRVIETPAGQSNVNRPAAYRPPV